MYFVADVQEAAYLGHVVAIFMPI